MWRRRTRRLRLGLCLLGLVSGCDPGEVGKPIARNQTLILDISRLPGLSQSDIERVELTVTGVGIGIPIVSELGRSSSNAWGAVVSGIPAGSARSFQASAFDSTGTVIYQGTAVSDVVAGSTLELVLLLQDPPPPPEASTPVVGSVVASQGRVPPSSPVDLQVTATAAAGESLGFVWTSDCPGSTDPGTFSDGTATSTSWTAPAVEPLSCVLSVSVAGSGGSSVTVYLPIQVSS